MSEANKSVVRKFLAALGAGDGKTVDALITPDCEAVCTGTSIVSRTRGHDEIVRSGDYFKRTMKDGIRFEILCLTAEEDRVAAEAVGFSELKNGVTYNNQYHFLFHLRDGKVCKLKEYLDTKLADDVFRPIITGRK